MRPIACRLCGSRSRFPSSTPPASSTRRRSPRISPAWRSWASTAPGRRRTVLGSAPQLGPVEAMTYAAACTQRLRLGCAVFVSTLHSPVHLAKSLSTLDQLSHGRVESASAPAARAGRSPRSAWTRPVRRPVHRGTRADEGAVDRVPGHLRRGVLAAQGRGNGTQAGPEAVPADLVRRHRAGRAAPRRPAGRRVLRRGIHADREVRRPGPDRARGAGRVGPARRGVPHRQAGLHRRGLRTPDAPATGSTTRWSGCTGAGRRTSRRPRSPARRPSAPANCARSPRPARN